MDFKEKYLVPVVLGVIIIVLGAGAVVLIPWVYGKFALAWLPVAFLVPTLFVSIWVFGRNVRLARELQALKIQSAESGKENAQTLENIRRTAKAGSDALLVETGKLVEAQGWLSTANSQLEEYRAQLPRLQFARNAMQIAEHDIASLVVITNCYLFRQDGIDLKVSGAPFLEFGIEIFNGSCLPVAIAERTEGYITFDGARVQTPAKVINYQASYAAGQRDRFRFRQDLLRSEAERILFQLENDQLRSDFCFDRLEIFIDGAWPSPKIDRRTFRWSGTACNKLNLAELLARGERRYADVIGQKSTS